MCHVGRIERWRPACDFRPMPSPPPPPPGSAAARCLNQTWRWETGLSCNSSAATGHGHTPGNGCANTSYTRARGCSLDCVVGTVQLPSSTAPNCSPQDCRAACCANPDCESWYMNVGGNAGVPGCDSGKWHFLLVFVCSHSDGNGLSPPMLLASRSQRLPHRSRRQGCLRRRQWFQARQ